MFCNHCGTQFQEGQVFCASCGKSIQPLPPRRHRDLTQHIGRLGVLWIVFSIWRLIGAGAIFTVGHFFIGRVLRFHGPAQFVPAIVSAVGIFLLAGSLVGLAAGWGLLQRETWARPLALVLAVLSILDLPFGTALGAYTLWALLPEDAADQYRWMRSAA